MKNKLRPLNKILLDIEPYLLELADHELQWPDYHGLLHSYLMVHLPDQNPEYEDDGSNPIYFIGPKEKLLALAKKLK